MKPSWWRLVARNFKNYSSPLEIAPQDAKSSVVNFSCIWSGLENVLKFRTTSWHYENFNDRPRWCFFIIWSLFQSWKHCKCTWIFKDSCSEERVGSEYCQSSIWLIWNYCKLPQKSFLLVLEVDAKQWPHNMMRSIALLTFFSYFAVKKIRFCAMIIISTKNVKQLKSENNNRDCPLYIIFVSTNWSMTTNV